jgi:hypothetical protein
MGTESQVSIPDGGEDAACRGCLADADETGPEPAEGGMDRVVHGVMI